MKANNYQISTSREKCQCITFDTSGKIMGSCDSLFNTSRLSVARIKKEFPFLWKILSQLKNDKQVEPLFLPEVDFECNGYHSICDFTFMKSEDALGIKRFICMIYDNSIHYKELIRSNYQHKNKQFEY
jgi:hypothetical protein